MKKYEYSVKRIPYNIDIVKTLNDVGEEGWQCIHIERTSEAGAHALYLMREHE